MKAKTEEEVVEAYKKEITDAKLHELSYDLQMEYFLTEGSDSSGSEKIKNLSTVNDAIIKSISKYGEMLKINSGVKLLLLDYQETRRSFIDVA